MNKLIISAAVQGAELTKKNTPYLPVTPEEISIEAKRSWEAGAAIIHLHVRDKNGNPTQDAEVFREHIEAIQSTGCQAIIQVSTGGAVGMTVEKRAAPITLQPEYATLNTGSINFGDDLFVNTREIMENIAKIMQEKNVRPEFEVYEEGHIHNAYRLVKKGLVTGQINFQFVLGVPGAMSPSYKNLLVLKESIDDDSNWTVAGIGKFELILGGIAVFMGGHVRVGLEDNIYYSKGVLAKSNAELVERMVSIGKEAGRDIATPDEARDILGITQR